MGVSIYASKSEYEFDMGYATFFRLRTLIATRIDEELGEAYSEPFFNQNYRAERIKNIVDKKHLDTLYKDVLEFLFMSDCSGSISYKVCRQLYDLLKDVDKVQSLNYVVFRYDGDWNDFKTFLLECYFKHRRMRWS